MKLAIIFIVSFETNNKGRQLTVSDLHRLAIFNDFH